MAGACWGRSWVGTASTSSSTAFYPPVEEHRRDQPRISDRRPSSFVPLLWPDLPYKFINILLFLFVAPVVFYVLIRGGIFGLPFVPTENWGGLTVTLIVSIVGITGSIPLGYPLGTGPAIEAATIATACILFIELMRADAR